MMIPDIVRLNIAVIDANPLLADGISALLGQEAGFAATAVPLGPNDAAGTYCFDVILIDPSQLGLDPAELARRLSGHGASLVAYSDALSVDLARSCLEAGFRGVLPKTVSIEVLKAALATTAQGGIFIDAAFSAAIAHRLGAADPVHPAADACLSTREKVVLKSVAHGKTLKEIGQELDLSSKTVETYKARGSMKLNLSGRRQIVEFAIAQGWVEGVPAAV